MKIIDAHCIIAVIFTNTMSVSVNSTILSSALFFERFLYDFQLNSFFKIDNFLIFKIILFATYFNMLNQIFLSFQIANSYLKTPTIMNFIIIIVALIFINPLFSLYNIHQ